MRPRRIRRIFFQPNATFFKPAGIPLKNLDETVLNMEEVESIRLIDYENIEQGEAAKKMKVSQPTLSRILKAARKKIADSIVNSKSIKIQGGDFKMVQLRGRGLGQGGGRMGRFAPAEPSGTCKCLNCDYEEVKVRGVPCVNKKCPKCGGLMTRGK